MKTKSILWALLLLTVCTTTSAQLKERERGLRETHPAFFKTDEARRIGEQVLLYQRVTGGWPKNINMARPLNDQEREKVLKDQQRRDDSTTDNGATTMQMAYLARLYQATKDAKYRDAVLRGAEYLLSGQYDNGGWPQFWPDPKGYQIHITYNDDAMIRTLEVLRDMADDKTPYQDVADKNMKKRMHQALEKGVECILKTQIVTDGELTVWCQQHDRETYLPAPARAFELPSYCSTESGAIVRLLMTLPNPDERVKKAVHAAMRWLDNHKLTGVRQEFRGDWRSPNHDRVLVEDATARKPLWARYYDLKHAEPFVCDRDGIPRRRIEQIGHERRNGYGWYVDRIADLYPRYEAWADKYDPQHKVTISLTTKGMNENGTYDMYARPAIHLSDFDAIVEAGQSIQAAIEKAPAQPAQPYKILIKKGIYDQKVIIDRPNIVLVGEQRDSTIIQWAELSSKPRVTTYQGQPVKHGVVELLEGADDCLISGLTIYNNYGTTVEKTTSHQFAVYGRATRTIIINSNVCSDGNDALSLWAPEGNGMYYHADLFVRCSGVDFLCPRGWCYATRCRFEGDGHAIIWHDGRGDPDKKLVIVDSQFDAKSPTTLGRYHHDSQFYLVHCQLSSNILDEDIHYAYTDKVLDPCPWGKRTYYWACWRDGGDSGWLRDNLQKAPGKPEYHTVTARWTFGDRWDPEARIRDLWKVVAY
ncbi:MAG: pectate lyase [Prevotella sp.]|nr:pectate lyase [Prevotella sp.]